jgi:subtilisin family serine protease
MSLIEAEGATVQATTVAGLYALQVPAANVGQLALELAADPAVEYADPARTVSGLTVPNDPEYTNGDEWQLSGTWSINVPVAWNITTGSDQVIVANTDSGIAYNDPDLYDNVWINQAEVPSTALANLTDVYNDGVITFTDLNNSVNQGAGKIVDGNGDGIITATDLLDPTSAGGWADGSTQDGDTAHPDDLIGWNFASENNDPIDKDGHGTFTAGEIGAVGNNGIGVAGTDWNVQLMPVQFLDSSGNGTDTAAAEAIDYAVDHGAKVINASWGSSGTDSTIAAAIDYAEQHGVIIVAAAGNDSTDDDNSSTWFSPASYSVNYPNLITVAATDSDGNLASFSNYGIASVQLAAPGVNIEGMELNGTDGTDSGTSMAAPLVTGTIALVEAAHPSWSMSQVIDAILDTTTPDPNLVSKVTTGGIVNAGAAVANTDGPYVLSASPGGSVNSSSGFSSVSLNFNEEIDPATFTPAQVTVTGPEGTISGVAVTPVSGSNDHSFTISFPTQFAAGTYTLRVGPDVQDWYGNDMNQNRDDVNGQSSDGFVDSISCSTDLLSVTGFSKSVAAGMSGTFTVMAMSPSGGTDTSFLGTIDFSSTDSQAGLPVSYTFTDADAGTHNFTVTLKTAGTQAITSTDTADEAIIGTEDNIVVQAGAATSLKVAGFPTAETAGTQRSFNVAAYDAYGNLATGYTGTVHFTTSDGQASIPADDTFTPEDQGTLTFSGTLETAGTQSITATDTIAPSLTGTDSGIMVQAAAAKSLTLIGFPASDTAGTVEDVTITAYDEYGNVATGYAGTVSLTSSDPRAVLPTNYTFIAVDAGSHRFAFAFDTPGTQTITATDMATMGLTATESGITVRAAAAKTFTVTGFPATDPAGAASKVTVTALDAYGNVANGYTGTIFLRSSDPHALLPSSFSFVTADAGTQTFSIALETAGSQSITATDSAISSITGTESGITVRATPLVTWSSPATIVYGTPLGDAQLDASTNVPGTFTYAPAAGAIRNAGASQKLSVTFTPDDATYYTAGAATTTITVTKAAPIVKLISSVPVLKKQKRTSVRSTSVELTAEITSMGSDGSVPSGEVTFELMKKTRKKVKVTMLGTAAVSNGKASVMVKAKKVLKKAITIVYSGDADDEAITLAVPKLT